MAWVENEAWLSRSPIQDASRVSIVTTTYNRAKLINRAWESIVGQTYKNIEWIVVDDGSTDGTADSLRSISILEVLPVSILVKDNTGKADSLNAALNQCTGFFVINLDSDDELLESSVEQMITVWNSIPVLSRSEYFGVCGLCLDSKGDVIGNRFPEDCVDSTPSEISWVKGVKGDKIALNRLDILLQYKIPNMGNGFVPEGIVWFDIGKSFKTRYVNSAFSRVHYQSDGLTLGPKRQVSADYYSWMLSNFCCLWYRSLNAFFCVCNFSRLYLRSFLFYEKGGHVGRLPTKICAVVFCGLMLPFVVIEMTIRSLYKLCSRFILYLIART